jgi:NADPH:quinone reductase-like Zn-dependent oxidoreductase
MSLQIRSLVSPDGELELSLADVPMPTPADHEVVVRVDAAPINPSDINVLLARADVAALQASGSAQRPVVRGTLPAGALGGMKARLGKPLPVGNEGAGVVIAAGSAPDAQALLGKTVGISGGGMFAEHRCLPAADCLVLPEGATAVQGASNFVNPMTVLGMLETMRLEGHTALVHTAAASSLGQMLQRACARDGVPLVNVVRRPEQVSLLRELGATHVCDSSAPSFEADLTAALTATGATVAFDAIGGGDLGSRILERMEVVTNRDAARYSPYGSTTHKQLYIYGMLDRGPSLLSRNYGWAWGVAAWLLPNRLQAFGPDVTARLRARVGGELTTTFASHYTGEIGLAEALDLKVIGRYARQATGDKLLIVPSRGR